MWVLNHCSHFYKAHYSWLLSFHFTIELWSQSTTHKGLRSQPEGLTFFTPAITIFLEVVRRNDKRVRIINYHINYFNTGISRFDWKKYGARTLRLWQHNVKWISQKNACALFSWSFACSTCLDFFVFLIPFFTGLSWQSTPSSTLTFLITYRSLSFLALTSLYLPFLALRLPFLALRLPFLTLCSLLWAKSVTLFLYKHQLLYV